MNIRISDEKGLRQLTIDRPDRANALTGAMLDALADAVASAWEEGNRALVITGRGANFSAGADLGEARAGLAKSPVWERLTGAIAAFPGISIAAVNGPCAGGAVGIAAACDLRVGSAAAAFFYPAVELGFLPQPSDPRRLRQLVGPARAKALLLAGHRVEAVEALAWGLLEQVAEDALAAAVLLAASALEAEPGHVAAIKAMLAED